MNDTPSLSPADGGEATPAAPLRKLRDEVLSLFQSCGGLTAGSIGIWQLLLDVQHRHGIRGHAFEIGVLTGGAAAMMAAHLRPDERYIGIDIALQRKAIESNIATVAGLTCISMRAAPATSSGSGRWTSGVGNAGSSRSTASIPTTRCAAISNSANN